MRATLLIGLLCAALIDTTTALSAERRLNAEDIRGAILAGPVRIIASLETTRAFSFHRDGNISRVNGKPRHAGKWKITNDELCFQVTRFTESGCVIVVERSEIQMRLFLFMPTGEPYGEMIIVH